MNSIKQLKGSRVLITGGNGFIGSHLARRLIQEGPEIILLACPKSSLWRVNDLIPRLKIIKADITDYQSIKKAVSKEKPKKIFHFAAHLGRERSFRESDQALEINVRGTINLLKALENIDYDCFLNAGSGEEYGNGPVPAKESQPVFPASSYSASKSAATLFCNMYHEAQGCPIVTLRPFMVYGESQEPNFFIPELIISALRGKDFKMSGGKQTRDFIHVSDVVEGYVKASVNPKAIGEIINLGTGIEHSLREMAEKVVVMTGNRIKIIPEAFPYRPNEIWRSRCNNTKAQKILKWHPKVGIEEGLEKTIAWYSQNAGLLDGIK